MTSPTAGLNMPDRTGPKLLSVGVGKALDSPEAGELPETLTFGCAQEPDSECGVPDGGLAVK